ncbi:TonB-dependent receptor plug domain-containing protein (plasmid) [Neorhizobium galegae]|nr:TonB-dependent receptor plug domain-containing protein [Neorhizobium galegae]
MWSTAFTVLCLAGYAVAQDQTDRALQTTGRAGTRNFDIPAQALASALSAFNRQSGFQVTQASGDAPRGITANAVQGTMSPQQALAQMLDGTGIPFWFTGNRAALIGGRHSVGTGAADESSTVLAPIIVRSTRLADTGSGFQGTPDWVYETPSSVSVVSREAIKKAPSRNARDLLDNVAGVLVNRSEGQNPGMSINIRGLQDQNRVVTMIDGARQNFQRNGHGASQRTYVDTAFIREIDVEKSGVSGVGGAGALGGSVNFRTLVADDLIEGGKNWGLEVNSTVGSNAFNFDGSVVGAVRLSEDFSLLGGVSHKNIGAYKIGKNGDVELTGEVTDGDDTLVFTGQNRPIPSSKPRGNLTDDLDFSLSWLRNGSESSQGAAENTGAGGEDIQNVVNNTLTASFEWDPDSELIDLKARFWYNHTQNDELRNRVYNGEAWTLPVEYRLATYGASIENTSRFDTATGLLSLHYGVEAFQDDGQSSTPFMVRTASTIH